MAGLFVLLHSPGNGGPEARLRSASRPSAVAPSVGQFHPPEAILSWRGGAEPRSDVRRRAS